MTNPATPDPHTWVVVPLYNEASVIAGVIAGVLPHFPNIVCIDDGSTDGSLEVARRAGAHIVEHPINLGQGAALQTGIEYALSQPGCEYIVTFDADGQHRIDDAVAMVAAARASGAAIVFGSRFLDDRTNPGWMKRVIL
ncbi:MAG: glycosyltransferase family 2 protein, partial [Microbacterium sp.]|nr:glycosyltransferase family 2 protein [Microbacterium sp.]